MYKLKLCTALYLLARRDSLVAEFIKNLPFYREVFYFVLVLRAQTYCWGMLGVSFVGY